MANQPSETLRSHQANERTLLAWIRTGIALMAFGFAIARFGMFLRQIATVGHIAAHATSGFGSAWMGAALVVVGTATNLLATMRYAEIRRAIERAEMRAPSAAIVYALGALATLVGLAMTVLLVRAFED